MNYSQDELKKLQAVEVEILTEIIRVCNENSITYFTVGGTTLGAVRHSGFIPWDDDIDIGMMRDDYERFLEIAPRELSKDYFLQCFRTDPNSPTYFAKVRKNNTLFVEEYSKSISMHHGVFVDIMPYDRIPEDERERKNYYWRVNFWMQLYIAKTIKSASMSYAKNKAAIAFLRSIMHFFLLPISKKALHDKVDKTLTAYNPSQSALVSSRGNRHFESAYSDIFPTQRHLFENIDVQIPQNYDSLLKNHYGDYMQLPPVEKRYSHAPVLLKLE